MHIAPRVLDKRGVDFEYEGEMTVDVALNAQAQAQYPFSRLSGPANILVVPARHSASISVKLMQEMAGATVIGPILSGLINPSKFALRCHGNRYFEHGSFGSVQSRLISSYGDL